MFRANICMQNPKEPKLIQFYESVIASGQHEEFCSAIAHVLKQNTTL